MKQLTISTPFKRAIITFAKELVQTGREEGEFVDEFKKTFDGMKVFIDKEPKLVMFSFAFPEDFAEGVGKTIYVGSN